jgi:organic radical activating enzyme
MTGDIWTSPTHCTLPTKQLALRHYEDGKLKNAWPCCNMMMDGFVEFGIPDVHLLTPQEIFDHPKMQELRDNLANGVRDSRCSVCWKMEDKGLKSYRQSSLDDRSPDNWDFGFRRVDLRVGNTCNLRCRMCDTYYSHSLMIDYRHFEKNDLLGEMKEAIDFPWSATNQENNPADDDLQWQWLMENTREITCIRASGGEPLYDRRMLDLLNRYIETNAAGDTILHFHTNVTMLDDSMIDILSKFMKNDHDFSVDGTGLVYEYIRHGASFEQITNNIRRYLDRIKPLKLKLVKTVNALNVLDVGNFIKWAGSFDYTYRIHFQPTGPYNRGIALQHLPVHLLELAKARLIEATPADQEVDGNLLRRLNLFIENNKENRVKMLREIKLFDGARDQHYKDFLDPALVSWLDG